MHYNDVAYWRYLQSLEAGHPDLPTPRVCRLLLRTMELWKTKPAWPVESDFGHLRDHVEPSEWKELSSRPIAIRKARAVAATLRRVVEPKMAQRARSFDVHPDELILGTRPPFSVGQGKELVRYYNDEETLRGAIEFQSEWGPMGHIVPHYEDILEHGLSGIKDQCKEAQAKLGPDQEKSRVFFESALIALDAVGEYAEAYARSTEQIADRLNEDDPNRESLAAAVQRLRRFQTEPPKTLHDALQTIFLMHCAFHWTQEIVPIGRLDQLLERFYKPGAGGEVDAQELLDCFWIKLDESVILDARHAEDRFAYADGPLVGQAPGPSNFDQGALLNQWMQQITLSGVLPNSDREPEDATNALTYLCLESARRLPLNSPTVDLRVHEKTPRELLELAARTLLSGGAHPVLLNDDRLVEALHLNSGGTVPLESARNYACDGCFETLFAGETEFSFGFVPALDVLEKTMNRGAGLAGAGEQSLRGTKGSYRTPAARDIANFDDFLQILRSHILLSCHRYYASLLTFYGLKEHWCPSPLLSCFILGCIETGRDLTAGGARFHLFSPLMTGISSAADSLYVINHLVFGDDPQFTLDELVSCLRSDWGNQPIAIGTNLPAERIGEIRELCLAAPKFGQGKLDVDGLAYELIETFSECVREVQASPMHAEALAKLKKEYDHPDRPFEILLAPGVGTFEQYNLGGFFTGASADGRCARQSIASDLSPAPIPADRPATRTIDGAVEHLRQVPLSDGLRSYAHASMNLLPDGGPADYNIPENYPVDDLTDILQEFANGNGGSVATFSVADPGTFERAQANPDDYNLLRVRMGGWTEFFIALFPSHQAQHRRRPLYVPDQDASS